MTGEKIYSIIALRSSLRILATHAGAAESDISALSPSMTTRTRRIVLMLLVVVLATSAMLHLLNSRIVSRLGVLEKKESFPVGAHTRWCQH